MKKRYIFCVPLFFSLAACAPTMSRSAANLAAAGKVMQGGQTWVVEGKNASGEPEQFSLELTEPKEDDGDVVFHDAKGVHTNAKGESESNAVYFSPAGSHGPEMLVALSLRNLSKANSRACVVPEPTSLANLGFMTGYYLVNFDETLGSKNFDKTKTCTLTRQ